LLISTGPREEQGIDGAFMLVSERDKNPGKGALNTIEISSVDEYIKKVEASGGKAITPKMPMPGVGYMAYCSDA